MSAILYPVHFQRNFERRWARRMAGSAPRRSPSDTLLPANATMPGVPSDPANAPTGARLQAARTASSKRGHSFNTDARHPHEKDNDAA